jgi:hypothetical protein
LVVVVEEVVMEETVVRVAVLVVIKVTDQE